MCSYWILLRLLLKNEPKYWFYYTLLTITLFYTHYYAALVILSQMVFLSFLFLPKVRESFSLTHRINTAFVRKFLISITIAASLFVPWVIFAYTSTKAEMPEHFNYKLLLRLIKELSAGSYPLSLLLILFAAMGASKLKSEQKYGHLILLMSWLLLPIPLIFLLIWLRDYFFAIRQILFTTPALFILVSYGVSYTSEIYAKANAYRRSKATTVIATFMALVSVTMILRHIPDRREDIKSASLFLQQNVSNNDRLIAPNLIVILSYYSPDLIKQHIDINQPGSLDRIHISKGRLYIVKSNYMSASHSSLLNEICKRNLNQKKVIFRGIEVTEFVNSSPTGF